MGSHLLAYATKPKITIEEVNLVHYLPLKAQFDIFGNAFVCLFCLYIGQTY